VGELIIPSTRRPLSACYLFNGKKGNFISLEVREVVVEV
jgi:hypothetical protein